MIGLFVYDSDKADFLSQLVLKKPVFIEIGIENGSLGLTLLFTLCNRLILFVIKILNGLKLDLAGGTDRKKWLKQIFLLDK